MKQAQLLDALARVLGTADAPASDYRIAKEIGCSRQHISEVRSGKHFLNDARALKLAELAQLDVGLVLTVIAAQRAKRTDVRKAFESVARKLAGGAIGLMLAGFLSPIGDGVSAIAAAASPSPDYILCAYAAMVLALTAVAALPRLRRYLSTPFFVLGRFNASGRA